MSLFRSVECPCCGYPVSISSWQEVEMKSENVVLEFCDMCESYFELEEVDNLLHTRELN